jgi:hypothetical protein
MITRSVAFDFLSSYYFKQLAQETILPLLGERQLLNRVFVVSEMMPSGG